MRHCHSQGRFAAYLIEWLISESVFSLHYLLCGSAWLHWWTDCGTQGDCVSQFSAPSFRKEALALSCQVQAKWASLPLALSTVVLESATVSKKVVRGVRGGGGGVAAGDLLLKWEQGQIWWAGLKIYSWVFNGVQMRKNRYFFMRRSRVELFKLAQFSLQMWTHFKKQNELIQYFSTGMIFAGPKQTYGWLHVRRHSAAGWLQRGSHLPELPLVEKPLFPLKRPLT